MTTPYPGPGNPSPGRPTNPQVGSPVPSWEGAQGREQEGNNGADENSPQHHGDRRFHDGFIRRNARP